MPQSVVFQDVVKPYSFVAAVPGQPGVVRQAGPGDRIVGVTGQGVAPAGKGGTILTEPDGRVSLLLSPTVGRRVRRGEYLRAGEDGYGVPATLHTPEAPTDDQIGAWVHEGGEPGGKVVAEVFISGPGDP